MASLEDRAAIFVKSSESVHPDPVWLGWTVRFACVTLILWPVMAVADSPLALAAR